MEPMISIRHLTKRFGPIVAASDVSFDVQRGEVLGFLGPNGAGKSTTMKMVTGFLAPTSGSIAVCGHDVAADPIAAKASLGYLPEGAPAYPDMTPSQFLRFIAEIRGLAGAEGKRRIEEVVELVRLTGVLRQPIETLSKGFKRRVGLAQAILHDPAVLILDEPTDGLDPNQKREVRGLIRDMARDKAIVLSTHILEEVEAVCTRAIIINWGKIVFDGSPADLQARSRVHNAVLLRVRAAKSENVLASLRELPGIASVEEQAATDGSVRCLVLPHPGGSILHEVGQKVKANGWEVEEMRVEQGRLDEVFHELTTSDTARVSAGGEGGTL